MLHVPAPANGVARFTVRMDALTTDAMVYWPSAMSPAALVTVTVRMSVGMTPPVIMLATPVSVTWMIADGAVLVVWVAPVAAGSTTAARSVG